MNFKIGDRVVLVYQPDYDESPLYNEAGTVWFVFEDNSQIRVDFDKSGRKWGISSYKFVKEELFNSPLYQALKEENENNC